VVADLIGSTTITPAVTHFLVSAPAGSTAGTPLSVTVTALDQNNNALPTYTGTVHFASSDPSAVLPADYTFTAGDNGSHTFTSGVTLVTAGSQTVNVTDALTPSVSGSAAVAVSPAGPDHLAFGQQPTNTKAGSAISPAVTVRFLDPYNNLVTSDQTDVVSVALGANPGGGTLSGTATAPGQRRHRHFQQPLDRQDGQRLHLDGRLRRPGRGDLRPVQRDAGRHPPRLPAAADLRGRRLRD
jgi:hypothetical protein